MNKIDNHWLLIIGDIVIALAFVLVAVLSRNPAYSVISIVWIGAAIYAARKYGLLK